MTPIESAKNLGPASGKLLRDVGIESVEDLEAMGWEEVCVRLAAGGHRNLNLFYAVIGAAEDLDWRELPPRLKAAAREFTR